MATINGSTNNSQWTFKLEATETATSILNKTSTVKIQVYLGRASSQSYLGGNYKLSVKCAGQTQSSNGNIPYPTYISGGKWYLLKTFTFTVSNTGNPTTISISSTMSSSDFTPSSASANGSLTLTKLHDAPLLSDVTFTETNQQLINVNVENDYFVTNLSIKNIKIDAITSDDATITKYEILNGNKIYSSTTNVVQMNLKENNLEIIYSEELQRNVAKITIRLTDSLGGVSEFAYPYNYVILYTKPSVEKTSTTIKRKTGNGTVLTDNKALLNFVGTCYKGNDAIGNNNKPTVQYKIWNKTEPTSYTTLTTSNVANVSIKDYEINNILYTSTYNYKIKIYDSFTTTESTINVKTDKVPTGVSVWTEYSDRIDFLKITQQNKKILTEPVILFEGNSKEEITLNDDVSQYGKIEIYYYGDSDIAYSSTTVYEPNEKNVLLLTALINLTGNYIGVYERVTIVSVLQNKITPIKYGQLSGGNSTTGTNYVTITKVLGYK